MPSVPGLRSPYAKVGRLVYFGRMLDKIRLHAAGRLSILAPIGTALIGFREGSIVDWPTPGGIRRLKIHRVTQPALAETRA